MTALCIIGSAPARPLVELRTAVRALHRRLREQGHPGDFTPAQKSVVLLLERDGPATVATLAKAEGIRHQCMRMTVAGLQQLGVLRGEPDPADGRQVLFQITPNFLATLTSARAAKDDWLTRALQSQLTPGEREELSAAVVHLNRLASYPSVRDTTVSTPTFSNQGRE